MKSSGRAVGRRLLLLLAWLLPAVAVADWWLLRSKLVEHPVEALAALAAGAVAIWLANVALLFGRVKARRSSPARAVGPAVLLGGLVLSVGAGLVNWAWSLQGYVVLRESDAVPLLAGGHLRALEQGPLTDLAGLGLTLQLVELDLRPKKGGGFYPESTVRIRDSGGKVIERVINPWSSGEVGSLRFFQGAYGFAPRLIVKRGEETLLDEVVTFVTEGIGSSELRFAERIDVDEESLTINGRVDTGNLDEAMRGHVALALEVTQNGRTLGRGRLLPGHFAEVDGGYRVGFGGMEQWSEIDFSRRNYREVMLAGFLFSLGGAVWTAAVAVAGFRKAGEVRA